MPDNFKLNWDASGERLFETGVRRGVLYVQDSNGAYPKGVVWNGLTSVTEKPTGAEANPIYADDQKYLNLYSVEEFEASMEAYTCPDEFYECDGSAEYTPGVYIGQQNRKAFGLCYRTALGNDVEGDAYGYKLHIIYGAKASPSERNYETINDSPEAMSLSWDLTTTPVNVPGFKPTASLVIDTTKFTSEKIAALEKVLYGQAATTGENPTAAVEARLPLPEEIKDILTSEG